MDVVACLCDRRARATVWQAGWWGSEVTAEQVRWGRSWVLSVATSAYDVMRLLR